jgi:hypothetical protein
MNQGMLVRIRILQMLYMHRRVAERRNQLNRYSRANWTKRIVVYEGVDYNVEHSDIFFFNTTTNLEMVAT